MKANFLIFALIVLILIPHSYALPADCHKYFKIFTDPDGIESVAGGGYSYKEPLRATECNLIAAKEAEKNGKQKVAMEHYNYAGHYSKLAGKIEDAKEAYLNAKRLALQISSFNTAGQIYIDLSGIETNPTKKQDYRRKAIEYYEKAKNYSLASHYSKYYFGEIDKAIQYTEQGAKDFEERGMIQNAASYYKRAADEYRNKGDIQHAKENYLKALGLYKKSYKESLKEKDQRNYGNASALLGIAETYEALGKTKDSQKYYLKAAQEYEKHSSYWSASHIYAKLGNWKKAYENTEKSMEVDIEWGEFETGSYFVYYPRLFVYGFLAFIQELLF